MGVVFVWLDAIGLVFTGLLCCVSMLPFLWEAELSFAPFIGPPLCPAPHPFLRKGERVGQGQKEGFVPRAPTSLARRGARKSWVSIGLAHYEPDYCQPGG